MLMLNNGSQLCSDDACVCERSQPMMNLMARLPDGQYVGAQALGGQQYYGTSSVPLEVAFAEGIPLKGMCVDLLRHASRGYGSQFRGTTRFFVLNEAMGQGAACWADVGGWVYELNNIPGWDVEKLLSNKVQTATGFGGAPYPGELEGAVDSRIQPSMIIRGGQVQRERRFLTVVEWIYNRNCLTQAS
ncbi:hypothetical protein N0725_04935 [Pseudomonas aeruginosa]|uniref:hypothetical protein n=1 Tax=Pseudomonas aeruginosa TaxID=287 RepID=UPI00045099AB|nr:hypothetical protein [Pseudomonas aeruginosa]ELK3486123.1 hypothetical protein [Pseudomonas aeruginosa]ELK3488797.1 hypothetical protein [Pseudomonas aeruginosa]EME9750178.1 hypothetical protein [Pseudomonas aeruginosa]ETU74235.1 hypothetical protein Q095_04687 [Pseudomonas aeruginosa PS50]MBG4583272.1 hypothetical protein [Pseudomonas aeruginosa]